MLPRILLAVLLTAPISALAQYVTVGPNGQVLPAGSSVVVVGQGGAPILTTPSVAFGAPAATPGISLSDRAGISNNSPAAAAVPSASESYPVYAPNVPATAGQPTAEGAGDTAETTGRMINDLGPSVYAGSSYAGISTTPRNRGGAMVTSLGEIAEKYKASRPQNIRTYTNADAERLNAMDLRGRNITPAAVQSAQATEPQGQAAATTAAAATPAATTPAPTAPQFSAGVRPSPATPAQASATTPQVSQPPSAERSSRDERNRLPASSTLLPLFGIVGLGCGALGLWLTKRFM
ncbi:MAG TPA: hypothetical protein VFP59_11145 [Candidatus Angelobacter sp.]|nr:hypothetical protein [Candidatus Angelobacter sp.]